MAPDEVLELPLHGVKRISNADVDILVAMVGRRLTIYDQFSTRNRKVDPHVEQLSLMMVPVWSFDHDVAGRDPIVEMLKAIDPLLKSRLDGSRWLHIPKGDS